MTTTPQHIIELAWAIAAQAEAIADGTLSGSTAAHAKLIKTNAETLVAWTALDT